MTAVPVFVNATRVEVERGATALDAVRAWRASAAEDVAAGRRALTDSRGLPLAPEAPVVAGTIVRLVSLRHRDAAASAEAGE